MTQNLPRLAKFIMFWVRLATMLAYCSKVSITLHAFYSIESNTVGSLKTSSIPFLSLFHEIVNHEITTDVRIAFSVTVDAEITVASLATL